MRFDVVTIFREAFDSFLATSLVGKALGNGLLAVRFVDPRDFTSDRHRSVDDAPFGGGEGMVIKPEPVVAALEWIDAQPVADAARRAHRVLLSPQGRPLDQQALRRLSEVGHAVLVCGRYEGFDERIRGFVDEELSLGDFVLNGGEVAAMAILDGVARLVPGVVGNPQSLLSESHAEGLLEHPQYTRPREFRELTVPDVLLEGNHELIRRWRREQMLRRTRERRPDLWARFAPTAEDRALLGEARDRPPTLAARTYVALLHHPVYDRGGRVVTTAITNLDVHDIARSARTFGLAGYFVVTPIDAQQQLARRIMGHWQQGHGARYNPLRREALSLVEVVADLQEAIAAVAAREGQPPVTVVTSAARRPGQLGRRALISRIPADRPALLVLGTGWGLVNEVFEMADYSLEPIEGDTDYNHLSVRSAAAILLDRLFGMREET